MEFLGFWRLAFTAAHVGQTLRTVLGTHMGQSKDGEGKIIQVSGE